MATDKTEPRIRLIVGIAGLSIVTLIALRAFLVTYFSIENDSEAQDKVLGMAPEQLNQQRETERQHLENGAVPIEQAMRVVSQGGRPAAIAPQPSVDFAPMQGWMQMPRPWVAPVIQPPAPPVTGVPMMQGGPSTPDPSAVAPAPTPSSPLTAAPGAPGMPTSAAAVPAPAPTQPTEAAPAAH